MNDQQQSCTRPDRSLELLHGRLSSVEQTELESHLDACQCCRTRLEQTAADREGWGEASQLLGSDPWRSSISEKHESASNISLQIQQVLQLLLPTDDPQMLGRIGGYEVSGVVGSGGMGVVLKAIDRSLDRIVAIKVLSPHLASSGAARRRFEREAKAAAAVLHPNVIAIHGVSTESVLPFLVMPYLRGVTLQKRIDTDGPLPVIDILRIGNQIASGLAAAHEQGLVHRDIKPANVLLEDGVERVAITDFGLARAVDDASMTKTGVIAGTPQYMSPEQARGDAVDARSDLFSLGSVMYAMCIGRPPFRAESTFGILRRITDTEPRLIREVNPNIPEWLERLVGRLLTKSLDTRIQTADHVASLLQQCLAHVQQPTFVELPEECRVAVRRSVWKSKPLMMTFGSVVAVALFGLLVSSLRKPESDLSRSTSDPASQSASADSSSGWDDVELEIESLDKEFSSFEEAANKL